MPNNQWGDFQTPEELSAQVVKVLGDRSWTRVLEPTCGRGSFFSAIAGLERSVERLGIEVSSEHAAVARQTGATVIEASIFDLDLANDLPWQGKGDLLVVGNPPWVTSAQLGSMGSANLPAKSNLKKLSGFDAMTGSSNFDIAEFILLKLMAELVDAKPTVGLLVKTQVARNVLLHAATERLPYSAFAIHRIDAKRWFGASVDACLFSFAFAPESDYSCEVFAELCDLEPVSTIGVVDGRLVADLAKYKRTSYADGRSPLEWRSGVKHDASAVMELPLERALSLDLEDAYVFPMLKCSDIFRGRLNPSKRMVIPQHRFGEDTDHLEADAPRLWGYLQDNSAALDGRRSSIYKNQPRFTLFGLGEYTFAPFKIAISGLHKEVRFVLLGPYEQKPVVVDDASYTLSFDGVLDAAMTYAILTSEAATYLAESLIFWDAKRPVNKKLLQRIDLLALARKSDPGALCSAASTVGGKFGAECANWKCVLDSLMSTWEREAINDRSRRSSRRPAGGAAAQAEELMLFA